MKSATASTLKILLPILGGLLGILMGLANVALARTEAKPICPYGEARARHCYMGNMTFCSSVKESELFPGLIECGADPRYCRMNCAPQVVDLTGKVKVYAYPKMSIIQDGLIVGQSPKGYAALYTSTGENLIRSNTSFWGCDELSLADKDQVRCLRRAGGVVELWQVEELKNFHSRTFTARDLVKHSQLDVCSMSRRQGEGLFQFWTNRFRIGKNKYAIHLVEQENGARGCQFQKMSGPFCWRLLVDEKGVICRNQDGDKRILNTDLSLEVRTMNFRDWQDLKDKTFTAAEIEDMDDQGLIEVVDRQGLVRLRD